jgi:hypothetical protein
MFKTTAQVRSTYPDISAIAFGGRNIISDYPEEKAELIGGWPNEIGNAVALTFTSPKWLYRKTENPFSNPENIAFLEEQALYTASEALTNVIILNLKDKEATTLISRIRQAFYIRNNITIANRLTNLFAESKEEEPNEVGINTESLNNYLKFIQSNPVLKSPLIGITPDKNIYVTWEVDKNKFLSIHFLPKDKAQYVIFKPDDRKQKETERLYGTVLTDSLMDEIKPRGVLDWISE